MDRADKKIKVLETRLQCSWEGGGGRGEIKMSSKQGVLERGPKILRYYTCLLQLYMTITNNSCIHVVDFPLIYITAGAYPGFHSMKRLGVLLLLQSWMGCISPGFADSLILTGHSIFHPQGSPRMAEI